MGISRYKDSLLGVFAILAFSLLTTSRTQAVFVGWALPTDCYSQYIRNIRKDTNIVLVNDMLNPTSGPFLD